jgi:hypothetical protein
MNLMRRLASVIWLLGLMGAATSCDVSRPGPTIVVAFSSEAHSDPVDGRVLLLLSKNDEQEPREQVRPGVRAIAVYGLDVDHLMPDHPATFDSTSWGYPVGNLAELPAGDYYVQAVLHLYETFQRANGPAVKLPMDRGEGQRWSKAPGNLYSTPRWISIEGESSERIEIVLDQVVPPIEPPADTRYVRHVRIQSERLTEFWGRPMHLGAHILLPEGFDEHPEARYPVVISHGHFPADFGGFRTEPPDAGLEPDYSERFDIRGYNRIQQEEAYAFYQKWIGPDFPRFLIVEIQHANPFYDDSYAVNSANLGPYGDAITYELIPFIEEQFRGIGEGWSRFLYGGSTGGWEALAVQVFYPEEYNGCFAACPDPIDFRHYVTVNVYEDGNAYEMEGPFQRVLRPEARDWLGHVRASMRDSNHLELALGSRSRSGGQYDIWQAVFGPMGEDGYPRPIWDKFSGEIDPEVAEYWRENYDLRHIMERDWARLGPKLEGKIRIYCGDMDNYYLNNAVYVTEEFLESTTDPYYAGEVDYGDRAEHCWNGDQENPNHISRLRYNSMYVDKIVKRIEDSAPPGADLTSWRY